MSREGACKRHGTAQSAPLSHRRPARPALPRPPPAQLTLWPDHVLPLMVFVQLLVCVKEGLHLVHILAAGLQPDTAVVQAAGGAVTGGAVAAPPLPSQPGSGHARLTVSKGRGASGCRLLCMQHRAPTLVAAARGRFRLGAMRLPRLDRICSSTSSLGRGCCDQSLAVRVPWARSFAVRGVLEGRARKLLCKRTMGRGFCLTSSPRRYIRYEGLGLLETGPKFITQFTICRVNEVEI